MTSTSWARCGAAAVLMVHAWWCCGWYIITSLSAWNRGAANQPSWPRQLCGCYAAADAMLRQSGCNVSFTVRGKQGSHASSIPRRRTSSSPGPPAPPPPRLWAWTRQQQPPCARRCSRWWTGCSRAQRRSRTRRKTTSKAVMQGHGGAGGSGRNERGA